MLFGVTSGELPQLATIQFQREAVAARIDAWAEKSDVDNRSDAIRRLVEPALKNR